MDNLSLLNLLLSLSYLSSLVLSGFLALVGRRFPGSGLWLMGQGLNALGAILDASPWANGPIVLALANTAYIAACVLFFHSIWSVRFGSRLPWAAYLWIPIEALSFGVVANEPYLVRTVVFTVWLGLGTLANGLLLLWKAPRGGRLALAAAAAQFLIVAGACVVRVMVLGPQALQNALYDAAPINTLYVAGNTVLTMFTLFEYFLLSQVQTRNLLESFDRESTQPPSPAPVSHLSLAPLHPFHLSAREWEVAQLVIEGLSSRAIGDKLFISPGTVKNHLAAIFRKTGCVNRADLVRTLLVGRKDAPGA